MAMTTMTSLVAAGLYHSEASLRTAEALREIYKIQPYTDSTIRRHHLKYRKTGSGGGHRRQSLLAILGNFLAA